MKNFANAFLGGKEGAIGLVILAVLILLVMPMFLDIFRLNLMGKYLTFAFVAIGLVLCWGHGGILFGIIITPNKALTIGSFNGNGWEPKELEELVSLYVVEVKVTFVLLIVTVPTKNMYLDLLLLATVYALLKVLTGPSALRPSLSSLPLLF